MNLSSLLHTTLIFLFVLDPIGNIPLFVSVLRPFDPAHQRKIILREMVIALFVMLLFLFFGHAFFHLLHIDTPSLQIAGGVILFLIAIKMIIALPEKQKKKVSTKEPFKEPLIVPLAIPAVAGPAILATISLYGGGVDASKVETILAILISWGISLPILLLSSLLRKTLGDNALIAIERLFGYLLVLISVQMAFAGLKAFISHGL